MGERSKLLSALEVRRLAGATGHDPRTIVAAYEGRSSVRETTLFRLRSAAAELGLPFPPEASR